VGDTRRDLKRGAAGRADVTDDQLTLEREERLEEFLAPLVDVALEIRSV
jgi:hypothetical protein